MSRRPGRPGALAASLLAVAALVLLPAERAAADGPTAAVDRAEAGKGGSVTVTGTGWRPGALLTLLICGQNMVGGTNDCANADGRAVRVGDDGRFGRKMPVAEPPKPCPCVVHVATVTGERAAADAAFRVAGHPVEPLPRQTGGERLSVLGARLEGSSGLLTWFGAPPRRKLVVTVGNLGPTPARDPVFRVGTAHGVLAPAWEEQRWRGTVAAGAKARVALDVELSAGAHGDYVVSLEYGGKLLVEQPWAVPRPWGVTLFWALLCVVVPATVFRAAMAAVAAAARRRDGPAAGGTDPARRHRAVRAPRGWTRAPSRPPGAGRGAATGAVRGPGAGRSPDAGALPEPGAGADAVRGPGAATDAGPGVGTGTDIRAGANPASSTGAAPGTGADIGASPDPGRTVSTDLGPGAGPRPSPCGGPEAGPGADAVPGPGGRSRPGAATDAAPGVGTGTGTRGVANPAPGSGPAPRPIAAREGLPWFGADTQPRVSAPSEDGPTKGTT
ncbi:hypothetical protein FHS38_003153 [Streptomyces netropsis]|uniref:Neocarzinostatin family protein n=1 Tax=Streptomyces netropsis TaxID=55404 RepID=A0A7W7LBC8_STRNE|nr:hypothetical protein [Streptomyces netropsis]GGR25441.1 hypothetical protein GCM10010219_33060 [Streptomyces netropsis]